MRTDKIRKYLIPNIPYLFILWAFLKLGTAYRLAAGNDFAHKLIGLGQTIGPAFADFAPGLAPLDWLVGIVGAVGFRLLIYFKSKNAKKFRRDAEYGSARWGTEKDIKPFVDPKFENNVILTGTEFLTMNTRPKIPANIEHQKVLERAQQDFFSSASHELKTPITIIKGQLEGMLLGIGAYKDHEKYLARSLEVAATLETMVQEILTISRLETNVDFKMEHFDCAPMIHGYLREIDDLVATKELQIHLAIQSPAFINIKVYENGNISVKFKFADELRKIAEYIEINTTEDTAVAG